MALSQTIAFAEKLCNSCTRNSPSTDVGGRQFRAARLSRDASIQARYGTLRFSQLVQNRMVTVHSDAYDGMKMTWGEFIGRGVQSRATGGLSKFDCGFDPSEYGFKETERTVNTELLYIHSEDCMKHFVGSKFMSGQDGYPQFIFGDNTITAGNTNALEVEVMASTMENMVYAIDGTSVLGNWAGDNRKGDVVMDGKKALYPHFDGAIKQALLNGRATSFHTVDVQLPALTGGDCYFIECHGQKDKATDLAGSVAAINLLSVDVTGKKPYSAIDKGSNVVRITANEAEMIAYGRDGLKIYYSPDGTFNSCDAPLSGKVVTPAMAYSEEVIDFKYDVITEEGSLDYWKAVEKRISIRMGDLFRGMMPDMGFEYFACDPNILVEYEWALWSKFCQCEDPQAQKRFLETMGRAPRIPYEPLRNTGLWFWTFQSNLHFLTNITASANLANTKTWYDDDCDTIKHKSELLAGLMVGNFSLFATNAFGSPFEEALNAPYQPENIPHLSDENRPDAIQCATLGWSPLADVCWEVSATTGSVDLMLKNETANLPEGATFSWTIYTASSLPVTLTDENPVSTITDAELNDIVTIEFTITVDGDSQTTVIPATAIYECC